MIMAKAKKISLSTYLLVEVAVLLFIMAGTRTLIALDVWPFTGLTGMIPIVILSGAIGFIAPRIARWIAS